MFNIKTRVAGIFLCFALFIGVLPVQAASQPQYVTREQAVVSLLNTVGYGALNETKSDLSIYPDAKSIDPQDADEISIAITNGILSVKPGDKLDLGKKITRLELATIVNITIRELPDIKVDIPFSDVPAANLRQVEKLVGAGLINGYGNGKLGSNEYLTQAQLTIILNNIKSLSSVRPQDDLYYAINRNWLSTTKLPAGYPGIGSFDEVNISNNNKMKTLVNDLIKIRLTGRMDQRNIKCQIFIAP